MSKQHENIDPKLADWIGKQRVFFVATALVISIMLANAGVGWCAEGATAETPFCTFVKKVIAAAPTEFAECKGEEVPFGELFDHSQFKGRLTLDKDMECKLIIRHTEQVPTQAEPMEIQPQYICEFMPRRKFDLARPVYETAATDLRKCFPTLNFKEKKDGDEFWSMGADGPGFNLSLTLVALNPPRDPKPATPGQGIWGVILYIVDTAPAKGK